MTLLAVDRNGHPIQAGRPTATQRLTTSAASSALAQALDPSTTLLRVVATADCHIAVSAAPTATTTDLYLPAGVVDYLAVRPGIDTLAAIRATQDGDLFVTEMG